MAETAALITAFAALFAALAWPVTICVLLFVFRGHLQVAARNLPSLVGRMQKVKLGAFEAELSAKAADLVDEAMAAPGVITPRQIRSAARIKVAAKALSTTALGEQLQQQCIEYETIRKVLPPGAERTRAMLEVLVRMRTLAPSVMPFLADLKASASSGNRLAAIAIMQTDPNLADLDWLVERFGMDHPFIFFQAATVLRILLNLSAGTDSEVIRAAGRALAIVRTFEGEPDRNTVELLTAVAQGRPG